MIVLAIVLAVIVVLAVVLVVNAVRLKPTPVADPLPPSDVRGDDAAVERFQEMLRCPTVWGLHATRMPTAARSTDSSRCCAACIRACSTAWNWS